MLHVHYVTLKSWEGLGYGLNGSISTCFNSLQKEEAMVLVRDAIAAGIFNDLV